MSDHWNSLANLLGTPSLSPQSKKSADGAGAKLKEIAQSQEIAAPAETIKSSAKEPSKLRSGWDAVTSFFGIQSSSNSEPKAEESSVVSEPVTKQSSPPSRDSRTESKPAGGARGSKKSGKPSFFTDDAVPMVEPVESRQKQPAASSLPDVFAATDDEPVVSFGGRRRERNDRKENNRSPRESRDSVIEKNDSPRQVSSQVHSPVSAGPLESDDVDGPVERRSQRRAPRRGRSDDLDEGAVEAQPTRSVSERREPASNRRSRTAETPRSTEAIRSTETVRDESSDDTVGRTEESRGGERQRGGRDRSGRDRSPRNRPDRERPERTDRAERTERPEREIVDRDSADRDEATKDSSERDNGRRGRDRRSRNDDTRSAPERRRPDAARRAPVDEVGFGAGLRNDNDDDDDEFVEADDESSDSVEGETSERTTEGPRRGRNQRRGRRSSSRASNSADDAERMEADESEKKFIKVPSWIEALDGILQSNMDNHQRNNHSRDRNRGRGPRNNDR